MDLKDLEPYIVVPLTGEKVSDHDASALRIMDGEIEPGIKALWNDDEDTLVAFLFAGSFTEEKARAWVREREKDGINLLLQSDISPTYLSRLVDLLKDHVPPSIFAAASTLAQAVSPRKEPVALIWEETENEIRHQVRDPKDFRPDTFRSKTLKGVKGVRIIIAKLKASKVPKDHDPDSMVVSGYRFDKKYWTMSKAKKWMAKQNKGASLESFDDIRRRVENALTKLYGYKDNDGVPHYPFVYDIGPETVIFEIDSLWWAAPYSINEDGDVLLGELVAAERAWKERESDRVIELTLYAFPIRGALATEASEDVVGEDGELIWKEVCKVAQSFKLNTGRKIEITKQFLQDLVDAFAARVVPYVSVPADDHHYESGGVVPAEDNTGFVEKLKLVGQSLWAGFRITDPETREKVEEETIRDVSIYAAPDVHDPRTGQKWPWVLMHVLLTNFPQIQGLAPFGSEEPVAASALAGIKIVHLKEVKEMADEITLTAEEAKRWEVFKGLDLIPEEIADLQALDLSEAKKALAQRETTRTKARDLEVQAILLALQGQGEHDGVTQVKGTRHWPVVCQAVEKALKEQPQAMALSVNDDGKTGLDEVVLSIINSIPKEGRMSLTAQPTGDKEPVGEEKKATDEQIDDLDNRLR